MAKRIINKDIPISCIKISPKHWERDHSVEGIKELADSITERGQYSQILVRPHGKSKQTFELIAGKKRLMAVTATGARTVRCAVISLSDEDAEIASLEENLMQTELPTRERDAAMQRLHDLYKPRVEENLRQQREKSIQKAEEKRGGKSGNFGTSCPKSGRPKSAEAETTRKVAEKAKTSVRNVRRALSRGKGLTALSQRALDQKKITGVQANILAKLPEKEQNRELAKVLQESQRDTQERHQREKISTAQGDTAVAERMLKQIYADAGAVSDKVEEVMAFMDSKELDYEALEAVNPAGATGCIKALEELLTFLTK